jgi:hypothetical protein
MLEAVSESQLRWLPGGVPVAVGMQTAFEALPLP